MQGSLFINLLWVLQTDSKLKASLRGHASFKNYFQIVVYQKAILKYVQR